ncbi:hypothetical protein evm_013895 [Chilo suppressalis]|nr:hypothetical protein evm_013895 [Chilo suppressalis]
MFGLTFKNIMIHGVVTAVYNILNTSLNFELSDATGTVQVYYDKSKNNNNIGAQTMKGLFYDFAEESKFGNSNIQIMNTLMDRIVKKNKHEIKEGYQCSETSAERDVVWMEELMYLYDKYYLLSKN